MAALSGCAPVGASGTVRKCRRGKWSVCKAFSSGFLCRPTFESSEPESRFVEAKDMVRAGSAYVIVGEHEGSQSPLPAPAGISYLLVTLQPGESWTYSPPSGHGVGWLALANGQLSADTSIFAGEMVIFEQGDSPISLEVSSDQNVVVLVCWTGWQQS